MFIYLSHVVIVWLSNCCVKCTIQVGSRWRVEMAMRDEPNAKWRCGTARLSDTVLSVGSVKQQGIMEVAIAEEWTSRAPRGLAPTMGSVQACGRYLSIVASACNRALQGRGPCHEAFWQWRWWQDSGRFFCRTCCQDDCRDHRRDPCNNCWWGPPGIIAESPRSTLASRRVGIHAGFPHGFL